MAGRWSCDYVHVIRWMTPFLFCHFKKRHHICYFSNLCGKSAHKGNLRKKGLFWLLIWGGRLYRNRKVMVARVRGNWSIAFALRKQREVKVNIPAFFISFQSGTQIKVTLTLSGSSITSESSLGSPLKSQTELCLLGNSKSSTVANEDELPQRYWTR